MSWSVLKFSKYEGMTLPQILLKDLDWFFYMWPKLYGKLRTEADELARKATAIKIQKKRPKRWRVEYWFNDDGSLRGFSIVRVDSHQNLKWTVRERYLNLSCLHRRRPGHKRGNKRLIAGLRRYYFKDRNITKKRWEAFFGDDSNFVRTKRNPAKER